MTKPKKDCTPPDLPNNVGGGLDGVPAFIHASPAEIRAAYRDDLRLIADVLKLANECIHVEQIGSPRWLDGAKWIDAVRDAIDIHQWVGARRARMFLLSAVDGAVYHAERSQKFADQLRTLDELEEVNARRNLTPEELARFKAAGLVVLEMPTRTDAKKYAEVTEGKAPDDPVLFAAFIFRLRCAKFAHGLATQEAMGALAAAVASWPRSKGRPKKGDTTLPKWDAADALMKAAGLVGSTPESLESDWKVWQATRLGK